MMSCVLRAHSSPPQEQTGHLTLLSSSRHRFLNLHVQIIVGSFHLSTSRNAACCGAEIVSLTAYVLVFQIVLAAVTFMCIAESVTFFPPQQLIFCVS